MPADKPERPEDRPARGGARQGAGRKPITGARMARHLVILDDASVQTLRELADGNLSAGIREAARRVRAVKK